MKEYKINGEKFTTICAVNDAIFENVLNIEKHFINNDNHVDLFSDIYHLINISIEMGQNMEVALIEKNKTIKELLESNKNSTIENVEFIYQENI